MKRDDMRRFTPDVATVLKEFESAAVAERRRKALESPELQEAIAEMERERANSLVPGREADETTIPRVSAPSPWLKERAGEAIDPSALPSATIGSAAHGSPVEPVEKPVVRSERPAAATKGFPVRWLLGLTVAAIGAPIAVLLIAKSMRERVPAESAMPSATATESASPSLPAWSSGMPSVTAAPSARAVETATPESVQSAAPAASLSPPIPSPRRRGAQDDPYDAASPLLTAKTAEPPPAPAPTLNEPAAKPSASPDFIFRKRDP